MPGTGTAKAPRAVEVWKISLLVTGFPTCACNHTRPSKTDPQRSPKKNAVTNEKETGGKAQNQPPNEHANQHCTAMIERCNSMHIRDPSCAAPEAPNPSFATHT
eukprot:1927221-Amphidinium_carterae.1